MENNYKITEFSCEEELSSCVDSMLFDSGTCIAYMEYQDEDEDISVTVDLLVHGEVNVLFQDKDYRKPSQFPSELVELIKSDRNWDDSPEVYVSSNNWFEFCFNVDDSWSDGEMCECNLAEMSPDDLRAKMVALCQRLVEQYLE